jgi:hypothetical protein
MDKKDSAAFVCHYESFRTGSWAFTGFHSACSEFTLGENGNGKTHD